MYIPIVLGTARENRMSEAVTRFLHSHITSNNNFETDLIDVRSFPLHKTLPGWEDHEETSNWKKIVEKSDGFILVIPEYNHGYPGELKLLLDSAYREYFYKPVALVGVSSGRIGGARVIENIKPILIELGMVVLKDHLHISNVHDNIEEGVFSPESVKVEQQFNRILKRLSILSEHLKPAREKLLDE